MDVDTALLKLGKYGRWQITRWILLGVSAHSNLAVHLLNIIFEGQMFPHKCNMSRNKIWTSNSTNVTENNGIAVGSCSMHGNNSNITTSCLCGWNYTKPEGASSIVTDFNLVCSRSYLVELSQTIFTIGLLVGNLIIATLSDRFGRKPTYLVVVLACAVVNMGLAFSPNFLAYIVIRFFIGILVDGIFCVGFVLLCEHFPHSYRNTATTLVPLFWVVGEIFLTSSSLLFPNWRHLQIAISVPGFLFIGLLWVIDESIPWLAATGKTSKAERVLSRAAHINKLGDVTFELEVQEEKKEFLKKNKTEENELQLKHNLDDHEDSVTANGDLAETTSTNPTNVDKETLIDILKHRKLCLQLIIVCCLWIINNVVYYGIVLGIGNLAGNLHINMYILSTVDILSILTVYFLSKRWSRKIGFCGGHIIAGLSLLSSAFIPKTSGDGTDLSLLVTFLVMTGKFAITTSFVNIAVYTPEVFPTQTRNLTYGIAMTVGRLGAILAPFYAYLMRRNPMLPPLVCGITSAVFGIIGFYLPETRGRPLFQTIPEQDAWTERTAQSKRHKNQSLENERREKIGAKLAMVKINETNKV